jgi:hypothetical protein
MRRSVLAMVITAVSLSGCYVRGHEYREHEYREHEYLGADHRPYRHERWHGEDVYRREDGRWYVRRNNEWVVRTEIVIQ